MQCLLFALVFGGAVAQFSIASNTSATEKLIGSSRLKAPEQQRQYKICNRRKAFSTYHYRAITSDGFWGPGSFQYDVTLKENDCSYPQNINSDDLKVWWEAYGTGNYALPTGYSLYLSMRHPTTSSWSTTITRRMSRSGFPLSRCSRTRQAYLDRPIISTRTSVRDGARSLLCLRLPSRQSMLPLQG